VFSVSFFLEGQEINSEVPLSASDQP